MRLLSSIMICGALLSTTMSGMVINEAEGQSDLKKYGKFSDREVEVLQEFLSYLDSTVSVFRVSSSSTTIFSTDSSAYRESDSDQMINELVNSYNLGHLKVALSKLKSEKLFDDFWKVREVHHPFEGTTGSELTFNPEGRYFKMLERLSAEENMIKKYYDLSVPSGELTPGMVAFLFKSDTRNIDFHSEAMQLIWVVHYITLVTQVNDDLLKTK